MFSRAARRAALAAFLIVAPAMAGESGEIFPSSRHSQFLSYGLFGEEQTALWFRDAGSLWATLGGSIALAEIDDWWGSPQVVFSGVVSSSFRKRDDTFDLSAQTFDGRFALSYEMTPGERTRVALGLTHVSGHLADGTQDAALASPNLGEDHVYGRVIHDFDDGNFRAGGTVRVVLRSEPAYKPVYADQFLEWLPLGPRDNDRGTPYLAVGLEEGGTREWVVSWHVQAGVYFGSHIAPRKAPTVRFTMGYYRGLDPRLKYARLRDERASFPYLGVALNW